MRIALIFILVLSLSMGFFGCSSTDEEPDRPYLRSESLPPLRMPEGLENPKASHVMAIPKASVETEIAIEELEVPPDIKGVEPSIAADLAELEIPLSTPHIETLIETNPLPGRIQADDDGMDQLVLNAGMDKVWPRIEAAVKRLGFLIEDRSRGNQIYMIYREVTRMEDITKSELSKIKEDFERPPEVVKSSQKTKLREDYQIRVAPDNSQTTVTIRNKNGQLDGSALARHLLVQLKYDLEHPIRPL